MLLILNSYKRPSIETHIFLVYNQDSDRSGMLLIETSLSTVQNHINAISLDHVQLGRNNGLWKGDREIFF